MTLSPDEVRELCERRDAGLVADAASHDPLARRLVGDASPGELAFLVRDGQAARRELIEGSLPLVGFVVNRFARDGVPREELFQEGAASLVEAIDHFDPTKAALSTFVVAYIRGAVVKSAYTPGGELHMTEGQVRSLMLVRAEIQRREVESLPVSPLDVAQALGRSERWVREVNSFQRHSHLNRPEGEIDLADVSAPDPAKRVGEVNVGMLLRMLPVRERQALELVYGLCGDPYGYADASVEMGCSPSTVRRLLDTGLSHLRTLTTRLVELHLDVERDATHVTRAAWNSSTCVAPPRAEPVGYR